MSHSGLDPAETDDPNGRPLPVLALTETAPRLGLSPAQVAGSALAAVSGAVLASWLGVTGTLVGAALGSIVGTVGAATYTYSLQRGHAVVRGARLPAGATRPPVEEPDRTWRDWPWRRLAVGAAAALVLGLAALTMVEGLVGKPVSSLTNGSGGGTTLGRVTGGGGSRDNQPSPQPTTPTAPSSPSPTPTQEPSPTPSPTVEPSPTPSPTGSPSGSPVVPLESPTASVTP
ncbi:MAG TPA: hypothetical protein PLP61_13100 [Nocardioides sp.]|uniref:hypothetical protein n=1 Tax=Nocardioides sp. TaxID=35761 RepID=UPI002B911C92|nr:hypothetical protein [Nocardioides sp.]HQR27970.1 hypothetical protein [Nocardioides sp.]